MLWTGIPALANLGGIQLDGLPHVLRERRIAFTNLAVNRSFNPSISGSTSTWPSQAGPRRCRWWES